MSPSAATKPRQEVRLSIALGATRLITVGAQFLLVHIIGSSCSLGELAIFLALLGLSPWFLLADLGMGQPLQNAVATRQAQGEAATPVIAQAWLRGWLSLRWGGLALLVIGAPLAYGTFSAIQPAEIVLPSFLVMGSAMMALAVFGLGLRALAGLGCFLRAGGISAVSSLAGLATAALVAWMGWPLWAILLAWYGPGLVLQGLSFRHLAGVGPVATPQVPSAIDWRYLAFNLAGTVTLSLDYLMLARAGQTEDLVIYGFLQRCLAVGIILQGTFIVPMQTKVAFLQGADRRTEIPSVVMRPLWLGAVMMLGLALVLILGGAEISRIVTGHTLVIPVSCLVLGSAYGAMRIWADTWVGACLALGRVAPLTVMVVVQGTLSVLLWLWIIPHYGASGVFAGHLIAFLVTIAWFAPLHIRRVARTKLPSAS